MKDWSWKGSQHSGFPHFAPSVLEYSSDSDVEDEAACFEESNERFSFCCVFLEAGTGLGNMGRVLLEAFPAGKELLWSGVIALKGVLGKDLLGMGDSSGIGVVNGFA